MIRFSNRETLVLLSGLLLSIMLVFVPLLILRGSAYIGVHDQLDSVIVIERFAARFFDSTIPEFMGNINRSYVVSLAPINSVFYCFFSPLSAFLCIHLFTIVFSYIGMFLCLEKLFEMPLMACAISVVYIHLPFYPFVLTVMGQPLLLYAFMCLFQNSCILLSYAIIILFGLSSSFIHAGYADIILAFTFTLILYIRKHPSRQLILGALCVLMATYVICNISVFQQFLLDSTLTNRSMWLDNDAIMPNNQGVWSSIRNIIPVLSQCLLWGNTTQHRCTLPLCICQL